MAPEGFAGAVRFGTDGWRDVIGGEFTFANVALVTRAIAAHLVERGAASRDVIVAYDCRFGGPRFARCAAEALASAGQRVLMGVAPMPTPVAAFAVRARGAAGALMITASHNPPHYSGIKFIPHYGGPATPDITADIERRLAEGARNATRPAPVPAGRPAARPAPIVRFDPGREYTEHLRRLLGLEGWRRPPRVAVDVMYGAGRGYLERLLRPAGCRVRVLNTRSDALFGGRAPDPKPANLRRLRGLVLATNADLGAALDGDADRFALVSADGQYFSANRVLPLLYLYLLRERGWRGGVVRSLATTHLLDRIAAAHGERVVETPVGFKHIGSALAAEGAALGGEESGGITVRGHVPEKDGILGVALAVDMVARWGEDLAAIERRAMAEFGACCSRRVDIAYPPEIREGLAGALGGDWAAALGLRLARLDRRDGTKAVFEDGSWCLARLSGTEPVLRLYAEAADAAAVDSLLSAAARRLGLPPAPVAPPSGTS